MTCPTCGNAHTGECSVAALKARIERLDHRVGVLNTRERMVLDELGFAEDVSPVWGAVLLNIRDLRGRVKVGEAERDALRAQIADLEAKADPRIADLVAKVRAGAGTPDDLRVLCDVAERVGLMSAMIEEKDEALADRQRLLDLVRHQRGPLHDAELVSDEEYAALAGDHGAVARLEGYDEMRAQLAEANLTLLNERGEGEPPEPGWRCGGRPEGYADNWYYGVYDSDLSAVIWRSMSSMSSSDGRLVFGWFWRVGPSMIGGFCADPLGHMPTARAAMRAASKRLRGDG